MCVQTTGLMNVIRNPDDMDRIERKKPGKTTAVGHQRAALGNISNKTTAHINVQGLKVCIVKTAFT